MYIGIDWVNANNFDRLKRWCSGGYFRHEQCIKSNDQRQFMGTLSTSGPRKGLVDHKNDESSVSDEELLAGNPHCHYCKCLLMSFELHNHLNLCHDSHFGFWCCRQSLTLNESFQLVLSLRWSYVYKLFPLNSFALLQHDWVKLFQEPRFLSSRPVALLMQTSLTFPGQASPISIKM